MTTSRPNEPYVTFDLVCRRSGIGGLGVVDEENPPPACHLLHAVGKSREAVEAGLDFWRRKTAIETGRERGKRGFVCGFARHIGDYPGERFAAVKPEFAGDEVGGLDAIGAFIDRGNARIAPMLRGAGFLDEAHAAMDLHAEASDFDPDIGPPCLDQRSQHFAARPRSRVAQRAPVDLARSIIEQRPRAFGHRLHP